MLRLRLPSAGRMIAALLFSGVLAALIVLINGPWLRVERIVFAGQRLTAEQQLTEAASSLRGTSLLSLDSDRVAALLRGLPAVADAQVDPSLFGDVRITVVEKQAFFMWRTPHARLVGAKDGTLIASEPVDGNLSDALAKLPLVDDRRQSTENLSVGGSIPPGMVDTALQLLQVDPARLGSVATRLTLRLDDEHGFLLVSSRPAWQAAFGLYGLDAIGQAAQGGRIEEQVAAVRTLFASHPEASVSWVDARNPGKVYFRAKG